jgi:hypothetical protein
MPRVIERKTQSAEYWQAFTPTPSDIEFLRTLLLDAERPLTTQELALAVVAERSRREEAELRAELSRGVIYQPKNTFSIGDKLLFPALDYRLGEVVDIRPGENPEYGDFQVMTIEFGGGRRQRSFAAGLSAPHKLNEDLPDRLMSGSLASPEKLMAGPAVEVPAKLAEVLQREPGFATFENRWLHRDLMAEVHIGHLNIAEAFIEMRVQALSTAELQKELDLPGEIAPEIAAFSLQSALLADGRFDQVGAGEERKWFLRRLEPQEAVEVPPLLSYEEIEYDYDALTPDMIQLASQIDDEWSDLDGEMTPERQVTPTATLLLTYPHAMSGTLPLNRRARPFFPSGHGERTMVTLIDGRWGNRFPAWVNHEGRYIAGLRGWIEKHKLPAGALITLERRADDDAIVIDFRPKRMRREWMRWAQVTDEGLLDIQVRKQEIACEYDEQIVIGDDRGEDLIALRANPIYAKAPLEELVFEVFQDLAGLSGSVHPKTVYSAVNVVRRCPPEPVFAALLEEDRLERGPDGAFRLAIEAA